MLIALHGKKKSGKDTSYERILRLLPTAKRVAFADKLKVSAMRSLGYSGADWELISLANVLKETGEITIDLGDGRAPHTISGRKFFQWFGTEGHREVFANDFWVDQALIPVMGPELNHDTRVIIGTDCRFPNEAERIRELGGEVWEIIGISDDDNDDHASEARLPDHLIDLTIDNTVRDDSFAHLDQELTRAFGVRQT